MSDLTTETSAHQKPPKLEAHPVIDNGANGERLFAAQVQGLPSESEVEARTAAFQADQDAAFQARQVREGLASASISKPKVSTAMLEAQSDLSRMKQSDPEQAARIHELSAALKTPHQAQESAPAIVLKPTLRQRLASIGSSIASAFGLGKKETA